MTDKQKWTTEPWLDAGTGVVVMNGESMEPILMAQIVDHDNYEAGVACANVARAVSCVNAMQGIRNPGAIAELVEAARATHGTAQAVLQRAYNSAGQVCCQRPTGMECCGFPEPEWSEYDQQIMDELGPVERALTQALGALDAEESR